VLGVMDDISLSFGRLRTLSLPSFGALVIFAVKGGKTRYEFDSKAII